jgi:hypothetical protein
MSGRAARPVPPIDREKLRAMLRRIGDEYVFYMLDEAIDLLPPRKLAKLVGQYMDLRQLRPDSPASATQRSLLEAVKAFDASSRAGRYYVSFNVNSKNCRESSTGTRAFIAECRRLLDRSVAATTKGELAETREAFDTIAALLRHIDEGHDDVVFFADEGGSWQVEVDWKQPFRRSVASRARSIRGQTPSRRRLPQLEPIARFRLSWRNTRLAGKFSGQRRAWGVDEGIPFASPIRR